MHDFYEDFRVGIEEFFRLVGYTVEITDLVNQDILIFATSTSKAIPHILVYFFSDKVNFQPETLEISQDILKLYDNYKLIKFSENNEALKHYHGLKYEPYLFLSAYPDFFRKFMNIFVKDGFLNTLTRLAIKMYENQQSKITIEHLNQINNHSLFIGKLTNYPFIDKVDDYFQFKDDAFVEYYLIQEFNLFDKFTYQGKFVRAFSPLMVDLINYEQAPDGLKSLKKLKDDIYDITEKLFSIKNPRTAEEIIKVEKSKRNLWEIAEREILPLIQEHWPHYIEKDFWYKLGKIREKVITITGQNV